MENELSLKSLSALGANAEVSKRFLLSVCNFSSVGYWELDIFAKEIYFSEYMFTLFNIDKSLSHTSLERIDQAIHPDDRSRRSIAYEKAIAGEKEYDITYRVISDGKTYYVHGQAIVERNDTSNATRIYGIVQDVTEQFSLMRNQNDTINFFNDLIENNPLSLGVVGEEGKILFTNSKLEQILAYEKKELDGVLIDTILDQEFAQEVKQSLITFRDGNKLPNQGMVTQKKLKAKDGKEIAVEFLITGSHYEGSPVLIILFNNLQSRLNNLKEITGTIKHHLNNSLMVVRSSLEKANKGVEASASSSLNSDLAHAISSIDKTLDIIRKMEDMESYKKALYSKDDFIIDLG